MSQDYDPTMKALVDFDPASWLRMKEWLRGAERARELWTATRILMGLRHSQDLIDVLLQGVQGMKDSVTYQAIVAEGVAEGVIKGRAEEARRVLFLLGKEGFGAPDPSIRAAVEAIDDVERLEQLITETRRAQTWDELLATPPRRPLRRRRTNP